MRLVLLASFTALQIIQLDAQSDWIFPYEKDGLFGYTNTCADTITDAIFEEAHETRGGLGLIKYKGKYGFINNNGKIAIRPKFIQANEFIQGISSVVKRSGKRIRIAPDGTTYNGPPKEQHGAHRVCVTPLLRNVIIIHANDKYGLVMDKYAGRINGNIQYVADTLYPKFDTIVAITGQLMYVEYHSKFAFVFEGLFPAGASYVDSSLNFQYDEIALFPCRFHHDMIHEVIGVREGDLWGYQRIYIEPVIVTQCKYLTISAMNRGPALVEYKPGRYGYVDREGVEYFCDH